MTQTVRRHLAAMGLITPLALLYGCDDTKTKVDIHTAKVSASAYTMAENETKRGNVGLAAWGDQLEPGMKAIAVSRDLIPRGLNHNTEVTIDGLPGTYRVLDKMNKRWRDKIDLFMGTDKARAREWGKQEVTITWGVPIEVEVDS